MANTLGYYNPAYYANEALIWLHRSLGLASRVHLGFDAERRTFGKGDTINIKRPATFAAASAPGSAVDVTTESVQISLSTWQEVRFTLSDKELAYTGDLIVRDHIAPAAYALAEKIDTDLNALSISTAGSYGGTAYSSGGEAVNNVIQTRKIMLDHKVPFNDPSKLHFQIAPGFEADLLRESAFTQWQGSDGMGVETQRTGSLGRRYGFEFFTNQNVPTSTYIDFTDFTAAVNNGAGYAAGSTSIVLDALGSEAKIDKGRCVSFAGHVGQYVVTADATITTNAATIVISPGLTSAVVDDEVVTISPPASLPDNATVYHNLAFHRDYAALAMARLPDHQGLQNGLGIQVASIQDPVTGLAIRSRIAYDNANSAIQVVLDVLYGVKLLNPRLACRMEMA